MKAEMRIPLYQPYKAKNQRNYVIDCVESNWISSRGKYGRLFEEAFCNYTSINYATTVANGTVALHLAMHVLKLPKNSKVIVPSFTYIASVNAIVISGMTPKFCDCDETNGQVTLEDIETAYDSSVSAVIIPHLYSGMSGDIEKIVLFCKEKGLKIIEDCAEALGTRYKNQHSGCFGDIATFSFFGNKTITTGEGGMVASNNPELIVKAEKLKSQAVTAPGVYIHDELGFNYRLTNIQSAIGFAQFEDFDIIDKKKRKIHKEYLLGVASTKFKMLTFGRDVSHCAWLNVIIEGEKGLTQKLKKKLEACGVETRPLFFPSHKMKMYEKQGFSLPKTEGFHKKGLCLPSFPDMTEEQISYVVDCIKNV